ncbi:geranylgeranyl reductase family protein [Streptomyces sp. NPDC052236]|uniref:geranylgeranyl reductase family protein n=1 Tax=Streptomyces sp. NPDC052236 TaxID=3365686 RepID=UPI0037D00AB8
MTTQRPRVPRTVPTETEVVVVGAGPAGCSTAYHLALRGHQVVLLDRAAFPRDKTCAGAVTPAGVRLLAGMGVCNRLPGAQSIEGVTVSMGPPGSRRSREFRYGPATEAAGHCGLVVPRTVLDEAIASRAEAVGATFHERVLVHGLVRVGDAVEGVEVSTGQETTTLRARVVVVADGAASPLARQAQLAAPDGRIGHGISASFDAVNGLGSNLHFFLPLVDPIADPAQSRLPAYGWIFPAGPGRANIGVGVADRWPADRLAALFTRFVDELRTALPGFSVARPLDSARRARLNFGFDPHRSWAPGTLVVGDAAGLINPATGEGISFALESGKIAAEVIDAQLTAKQPTDLSHYANRLITRFSGHFEAGGHAAGRHRLALRVLEDTFDSEQPVFALTRRAMLSPDLGADTAGPDDVIDVHHCLDRDLRVASRLVAVSEIIADTVRDDWPFLLRVHTLSYPRHIVTLRPALMVLLAAQFGDCNRKNTDRERILDREHGLLGLAAAADLAAASAIAQASVSPGADIADRPNWGTKFAVLTADLLLARAFQLCVTGRADLTTLLAQGVENTCQGRIRELAALHTDHRPTTAERLETATATGLPAIFATACEIGASAAGAAPDHAAELSESGRKLGLALHLGDDIRRLSGGTDRLGRNAKADLDPMSDSLPVLLVLDAGGPNASRVHALRTGSGAGQERVIEFVDLIERSGILNHARRLVRQATHDATQALVRLPDGPARRSLLAITQHVEGTSLGVSR